MHARQWFPGLAGAGAVSALALAAGCASSSNGSSADAAAGDAGDSACTPQPVIVPDSGACGECLTNMCASALMACTSDCTCGGTVDMVARCLAVLPPLSADAGAGLGFLGPAAQLALCVLGGGGAGANAATTGYIACLGTSCSSECLGVALGDGGMDAAVVAESGPPEGGSTPEAGPDGGGVDAAPEAAIEGGAIDAPSEAAPDASDAGLASETSDN